MNREKVQLEWKRIGLGTGVGLLWILTMAALSAWAVGGEWIGEGWMDELSALTLILAGMLGGMVGKGGQDHGLGALVTGALVWLILLMLNAVLFDGGLSGAPAAAVAIVGGSGAAMLLRAPGHSPFGRRKYRYR